MTTVAVYAAQMKGQGVGDDDIIQQIRQQTGKHKPGPNDEVPGTPPSQPLPQGNGQPEGLGMAAPTPQGLTGQGGGMPASEVQARDAQIMSPGYNNQGVQGFKPQVSAEVQGTQGLMGRPPTPQTPPFQPGGNAFPMTREHVQPQAPQQMPEQSIFGRMGDGLKSMGQGMSGYMGKLFDDPNRMALLQGGLSMMDPNSYYDKQGFGSVFTGLNKGLGAAQGGMQGVLGRRKSRADIAKTKGEASPIDKIEVSSNNLNTFAVNKSKIDRDTKKYMREGMTENEAFARASAESSANIADKGMKQKDKSALFEEYSTGNLTLSKIKEAKNLVRPDTLSGLATAKRGFDQVLTFAEIAHNPSDATKLKTYMDELAFPMMQAIMGIPLNSRMLDSKAEKDFIKELAGNPTKYSDPAILASKLDMVEKLYSKLQNQRKSDLGYGPPPASGKTLGQKYDY